MKTDSALSGDVAAVLTAAGEQARKMQHEFVGPEHILLALLDVGNPAVRGSLERKHLNGEKLRGELGRRIEPGPDEVAPGQLPMSPEGCSLMEDAARFAHHHRHGRLAVSDLLDALLNHGGLIADAVAAAR